MEKIHLYDKILSPVVTEKSTNLSELNKIVFKVPDGANKKNLKKNIEKIFKAARNIPSVKVTDVNHFSAFDIVKFKKVVFTESSVKELEKRYS